MFGNICVNSVCPFVLNTMSRDCMVEFSAQLQSSSSQYACLSIGGDIMDLFC